MKSIKLLIAVFVFGVGLLVPAGMVHADRCDRSSDNANTTHPDNDHNGDHNCPVDPTTTVVQTTVPPELPHTGTAGTVSIVAATICSIGAVLLVLRKKF